MTNSLNNPNNGRLLPTAADHPWAKSIRQGYKIPDDDLKFADPDIRVKMLRALYETFKKAHNTNLPEHKFLYTLARCLKRVEPETNQEIYNLITLCSCLACGPLHQLVKPKVIYKWGNPDDLYAAFMKIYAGTKVAEGLNPVQIAVQRAKQAPIRLQGTLRDQVSVSTTYLERAELLASVCFYLQELSGPDKPFFLSVQQAGEVFGLEDQYAKNAGSSFLTALAPLVRHTGNEASLVAKKCREYFFEVQLTDLYTFEQE